MQIKTNELTGAALDWAVCMALGRTDMRIDPDDGDMVAQDVFDYTTDWAQGGPIIEREGITLDYDAYDQDKLWEARHYASDGTLLNNEYGPTPLIAAMRCYVASKLGDVVDIPEELCK